MNFHKLSINSTTNKQHWDIIDYMDQRWFDYVAWFLMLRQTGILMPQEVITATSQLVEMTNKFCEDPRMKQMSMKVHILSW